MTLAVIVPTRGRPDRFAAMLTAVHELAGAPVQVVAYVDDDDEQLEVYRAVVRGRARLIVGPRIGLAAASNHVAQFVLNPANGVPPAALASLGDDHMPRTYGWARRYLDELAELGTGIVYGDDLHRGPDLPTQWAMTADIVRALGRMVPAPVRHLYADTSIRELGAAAGCLRYLADVVVEHMHYVVGKAPQDAGYRQVNAPARYDEDRAAYERWLDDGLLWDLQRVRALRASVFR